MKTKTLLLGSAAVIGFSGASQAADLSVMAVEPVDYVRICDAFGDGYWYIPGTDTCIALGGYVRWQVEFSDPDTTIGNDDDNDTTHYSNWVMKTRAVLTVEARTQTDWGPLVSFIEYESNFSKGTKSPNVGTEDAFLSLGPVTMGRFQSLFDPGGGYVGPYGLDDGLSGGTAITDTKTLQVQLAWAFNGFGIMLSAEDPNYRSSANSGSSWFANSNQGDIPDLVAALTGEWGNVSASVRFLYADSDPSSTWGVSGHIEISDIMGAGDFIVVAEYLDIGGGGGFGSPSTGQVWSILASYEHAFTDQFSVAATARYDDFTDLGNAERWAFAVGADYEPVENFLMRVAYRYYENGSSGTASTDTHNAILEFRRSFGP